MKKIFFIVCFFTCIIFCLAHHYKVFTVEGVALVFHIRYKGPEKGDEPEQETVLCFGNWNNNLIKSNTDRWYYHFAFQHPKQTPFIENMVVTIKADEDRANDVIRRIDPEKIKTSLTK